MEAPDWIDRSEYPFRSHFIDLDAGRMHYIDEGNGPVVLLLHGNPTWSFMYRRIIKVLSKDHRCVAPDYIGFGLSEKPEDFSYLPSDHARIIQTFIKRLDLRDLTIVGHDWGGPIGISYAVKEPANVRALVMMNTWMWPVEDDPHFTRFSRIVGGPAGRFLTMRFNLFARVVMKMGFYDKTRLPAEIHKHYLKPFKKPSERKGMWMFPREVTGSTRWLDELWRNRESIRDKPTLLIWGEKDPAFRIKELEVWQSFLTRCKTVRLPCTGHYVAEERGDEVGTAIENFLRELFKA